jgi:hypothetical protein
VLSEFAIERPLFRLGESAHGERCVLKGAMLFKFWRAGRHRATWNLDLLGRGASAVADVVAVVRDLCAIRAEDAILFDAATIAGEEIWASDKYAGARVQLEARLSDARIPVQVDVGFGDAVGPAPVRETARTDPLVAKVREAIERLKELRIALIFAAVTGKIDVRPPAEVSACLPNRQAQAGEEAVP